MESLKHIEDIDALKKAFDVFNETTLQLESSYKELEGRVARLNQELEERNDELNQKVQELDRTKQYLSNILNGMRNGVVAINADAEITVFNPTACAIFQRPIGECVTKNHELYDILIPPLIRAMRVQRPVPHGTRRLRLDSGKEISIEENISLIQGPDGHMAGAVNVFRDMTEIESLEEEIRRIDRLKALGEMAATVAHEIRNPLTGIEGFASLLDRDLDDESPHKPLVKKIIVGTRSLNSIVTNMLYFTRPVKLQTRVSSVHDVIQRTLAFIQEEMKKTKKTGVQICYEACDHATAVMDSEQIKQVLLNILLNALQASPEDGVMSVVVKADQGQVMIAIRDQGPGMTPEIIKKVFNPFFTTKTTGTGLGLAISKKIVEAHHGRIQIKSCPGHGTQFSIFLPKR